MDGWMDYFNGMNRSLYCRQNIMLDRSRYTTSLCDLDPVSQLPCKSARRMTDNFMDFYMERLISLLLDKENFYSQAVAFRIHRCWIILLETSIDFIDFDYNSWGNIFLLLTSKLSLRVFSVAFWRKTFIQHTIAFLMSTLSISEVDITALCNVCRTKINIDLIFPMLVPLEWLPIIDHIRKQHVLHCCCIYNTCNQIAFKIYNIIYVQTFENNV